MKSTKLDTLVQIVGDYHQCVGCMGWETRHMILKDLDTGETFAWVSESADTAPRINHTMHVTAYARPETGSTGYRHLFKVKMLWKSTVPVR